MLDDGNDDDQLIRDKEVKERVFRREVVQERVLLPRDCAVAEEILAPSSSCPRLAAACPGPVQLSFDCF